MSEIERQVDLFVARHTVPGRMPFREFSPLFFSVTHLPNGGSFMVRRALVQALKRRGLMIADYHVALMVK